MKCDNCGEIIDKKNKFCINCGSKLNKKISKKVVVSFIIICVIIIFVVTFMFLFKSEVKNRTIMIYAFGEKYNYGSSVSKYSLENIVNSETDYKNNNILLFVDGTNNWFDFAKESGIYLINEKGPRKVSDNSSLEELLKYSYKKYKANHYDLVIWNYGLSNEKTLDIDTITNSLKQSKFNKNNKLEYINYIDSGTSRLEYALIFKDYSKYYIASEQTLFKNAKITNLSPLTNSKIDENAVLINKRYIQKYASALNTDISKYHQSYAIIDLDYVSELEEKISTFFENTNLETDYSKIAIALGDLFHNEYNNHIDNIDIYDFIYQLKSIAIDEASDVINTLNSVIVYNSFDEKGLTIYFPFFDDSFEKSLNFRKKVTDDYYNKFISEFYNLKSTKEYDYSKANFKYSSTIIKANNLYYTMKSDQIPEFLIYSTGSMYKKIGDLYFKLSDEKTWASGFDIHSVFTSLEFKQLEINDEAKDVYIKFEYGYGGYYNIPINLYYSSDKYIEGILINTYYKDGFFAVIPNSGYLLEISDFEIIEFEQKGYKLFKEDGSYDKNPTFIKKDSLKYPTSDLKFKIVNPVIDGEYKPVVTILDIYGKVLHNSNLIFEK